jgi:hypothetical protein
MQREAGNGIFILFHPVSFLPRAFRNRILFFKQPERICPAASKLETIIFSRAIVTVPNTDDRPARPGGKNAVF